MAHGSPSGWQARRASSSAGYRRSVAAAQYVAMGVARTGLTPLSTAHSASKTRRSSPDGYGKVLGVIGLMATG